MFILNAFLCFQFATFVTRHENIFLRYMSFSTTGGRQSTVPHGDLMKSWER